MRDSTARRIDLFIGNYRYIKGKFFWQPTILKRLIAMIYAVNDRTMNDAAIRESMRMVKKYTSPFSYFRGYMILAVSAMLSLEKDQKNILEKALKVYEMMKSEKFWASPFLVIAACQIAIESGEEDIAAIVTRARAFYKGMRSRHFLITGSRDYITVALLAISGIDVQSGLLRLEEMHKAIKPKVRYSHGSQAIAQVLLMGNGNEGNTERVLSLRDAFRQRKLRLDRDYAYPLLGLLALLGADADTLADEVIEAFKYMRKQKGFGAWSVNKLEVILFASAFVAMSHTTVEGGNAVISAVSNGVAAMVINQFIALIIMMTTTAVTSSTAAASAAGAGS
ncbi:MAG: DUF4003 family protein [Clostridiales bacterium]|nr:DUF4003 family protein [Clostridiales bacterium]